MIVNVLDLTDRQLSLLCDVAQVRETALYFRRLKTPSAEWGRDQEDTLQDWIAIRKELDRLYVAKAQMNLDEARKR